MFKRLACAFVGHDKVYLSDEECDANRYCTGMFRPWNCRRCGRGSYRIVIPPAPPMPPRRKHFVERSN